MSNREPVEFAGTLFRSADVMWPKPLVDSLSKIELTLPIRFFLALVRFIYQTGNREVVDSLSEVLKEDVSEEQLLSMTESQLQQLSSKAWICGGKVHLERRGVSRLFGAIAHLKRSETDPYLLETVRGISLLADVIEGDWNEKLFDEATNQYDKLIQQH